MSTKNLARTVIEGGRARFNRFERRHSHATERTWERVTSHRLLTATELEDVIYRPRRKVYRGHHDKLAPAERWLRSQVGRPWDKVRSELFARFDARTTAGRHVLFDHLLAEVESSRHFHRRKEFLVDPHGILRIARSRPKLFQRGGS